MAIRIHLVRGRADRLPLANGSVHVCITSPPYLWQRVYDGPLVVFDGAPDCTHEWRWYTFHPRAGGGGNGSDRCGLTGGTATQAATRTGRVNLATCAHCGAWLGQLGLEPTVELYIAHLVDVFREVRRVLRDDGQCFVVLGDKRSADRQWLGIPWRFALAMQAAGWRWEDEIIWEKGNAMPSSQVNRFTRSHEAVLLFNKSAHAFFDLDAVREPQTGSAHSRGAGITPKGVQARRGLTRANDSWQASTSYYVEVPGGRVKRTVWRVNTAGYAGAHFATYPPALVEPMVKVATSQHGCCPACGAPWVRMVQKPDFSRQPKRTASKLEGQMVGKGDGFLTSSGDEWQTWRNAHPDVLLGWRPTCACAAPKGAELVPVPCVVLDPFVGTGTTLAVANALGRCGIGVDLSAEYLAQARERTGLENWRTWIEGAQSAEADYSDLPLFAGGGE